MVEEKKYMVQDFSCTRGKLIIRGKTYLPKGDNLPIIVISHGMLGNYRMIRKYAAALAEMGYATVIFDFNGGGMKSTSSGLSKDMTILTESEDLKAVIEYAVNMKETDENKLFLMGCSQGGLVSAIVAAQLQDRVKKLILFYPALCIHDDAKRGRMLMAKFDPQNIPKVFYCGIMKLGAGYPESAIKIDPYQVLQEYKGKVQIIHGTNDKVVKPEYSKRAHEICSDSTFTQIEGAGHGFNKKQDKVAIACVKEFLEGRREILNVNVHVTGHTSKVKGKHVHITFPFNGEATGDEFKGKILPGAADEQEYIIKRERHLCAKYSIQGRDYKGNRCIVRVTNRDDGNGWKPIVQTDSAALTEWNTGRVTAVMEERRHGPRVHLFL